MPATEPLCIKKDDLYLSHSLHQVHHCKARTPQQMSYFPTFRSAWSPLLLAMAMLSLNQH